MFAVGRMEEATECRVSTLVSRFEQSNGYVTGFYQEHVYVSG